MPDHCLFTDCARSPAAFSRAGACVEHEEMIQAEMKALIRRTGHECPEHPQEARELWDDVDDVDDLA